MVAHIYGRTYWDCNQLHRGECKVQVITVDTEPGAMVIIFKGSQQSPQALWPDQEECSTDRVKARFAIIQIIQWQLLTFSVSGSTMCLDMLEESTECFKRKVIRVQKKTPDCLANGSHFFIYMKKITFLHKMLEMITFSDNTSASML